MKSPNKGYIFILMCCLIPVILLGTKLVLDKSAQLAIKQDKTFKDVKYYKQCAREAALAVAKKWNPGLTYEQQKWPLLKIADDIYNANPTFCDVKAQFQAIPGLELPTSRAITTLGHYDPLQIKNTGYKSLSSDAKTIAYTAATDNAGYSRVYVNRGGYEQATHALELAYYLIYSAERSPYFMMEDTVTDCTNYNHDTYCNRPYFTVRSANVSNLENVSLNYGVFTSSVQANVTTSSTSDGTIMKRVNENDTTVSISVSNNKIKVQTDNDIAYATPATCNIDIVLGIPTNGAACNANNNDAHTTTLGSPYYESSVVASPSSNAKLTPIYQIAQSFRTFIKNNLYYTRGVNVGLVPYSGNLSIPNDRRASWTKVPNGFVSEKFSADTTTYPAFFRTCYSYGTHDLDATQTYNALYAGFYDQNSTGNNIMRRLGKFWQDTAGGYNYMYEGDLLSNENPTTIDTSTYSYKFGLPSWYRVPNRRSISYLNFLYKQYFDLSTVDSNYNTYTTGNPYHVVELQANLLKITDLLNCFYPFRFHENSESNFIFLPVTWTHNLFKNWTKDPCNTSTTSTTELYREPKTTSGRKKAVIIVVNKPDWFEPDEFTYLGYYDDFKESPAYSNDRIDFSVKQNNIVVPTSSSKLYSSDKALSYYNSSNATYLSWNYLDNYYQCSDNETITTGNLNYSGKYLIKFVVEPALNVDYSTAKIEWTEPANSLVSLYNSGGEIYGVAYGAGKFVAISAKGYISYSTDGGQTWSAPTPKLKPLGDLSRDEGMMGIAYGTGKFVVASAYNGYTCTSVDGISWTTPVKNLSAVAGTETSGSVNRVTNMAYCNGAFFAVNNQGYYSISNDGITWSDKKTSLAFLRTATQWNSMHPPICYGNRKYISSGARGYFSTSSDGLSWSSASSGLSKLFSSGSDIDGMIFTGSGVFIAFTRHGAYSLSYDGTDWSTPVKNFSDLYNKGNEIWASAYGVRKIIAIARRGWLCIGTFNCDDMDGRVKFTNLKNASGNYCTLKDKDYEISERKEFYIEPAQLPDSNLITMDLRNVRLVSAEVTNYPYEIITSADSTRTVNVLGQPRAADNRNLNTALYYGTSGSTTHFFAWQSATDGTWNGTSSTDGLKNVTVSAIKKLFNEEGGSAGNLRIYFILYRRQKKYKNPSTGSETEFDYKYLTDLAANTTTSETTAASTAKPIYRCIDVSNESGLNSCLSSIAEELKTWAGYTEAKVVE